jgi:hypothetical protein
VKKRWLLAVVALVAILLLGVGARVYHWQLSGWMRGESFYRGYPTSYWRPLVQEIGVWWLEPPPTSLRGGSLVYVPPPPPPPPPWWRQWLDQVKARFEPPTLDKEWLEAFFFHCPNPAFRPVLDELANDSDPDVRAGAIFLRGDRLAQFVK